MYKRCTLHEIYFPSEGDWFPATEDYFYKNTSNKKVGLVPYCIECNKAKSTQWIKDNPEKFKASYKRYMQTDSWKVYKELNNIQTKDIMRQWRRNHPDIIKQYNTEWQMHKKHHITEQELQILYDYCNHCCMYCGMPEQEAIDIYGKRLFKDHFVNDGNNTIDNCILCCNGCSSSKRDKDFFDWYNPDNPRYDVERMNKIIAWIEMFNQ